MIDIDFSTLLNHISFDIMEFTPAAKESNIINIIILLKTNDSFDVLNLNSNLNMRISNCLNFI
jgi:hypothetical protein